MACWVTTLCLWLHGIGVAWPALGHHTELVGKAAEVSEVLMAWPALGHHAELVGKAAWDLEGGERPPAEVSEVLMAWPAPGHHAVLVEEAAWTVGPTQVQTLVMACGPD